MAFRFAGFFTRPTVSLRDLPPGAVVVSIEVPFVGTGVRIPSLIGEAPSPEVIQELARRIGVEAASQWIYLTYDCWAGDVDFVYGFVSTGGALSAVVEDSTLETTEDSYFDLMSQFGVSEEDAFDFAPFARGFWGDGV